MSTPATLNSALFPARLALDSEPSRRLVSSRLCPDQVTVMQMAVMSTEQKAISQGQLSSEQVFSSRPVQGRRAHTQGAGGACRCLCSASWQLRDAALVHIAAGLKDGSIPRGQGSDHARELVRACGPLLVKLLGDKVAAVAIAAMQVPPPSPPPPLPYQGGTWK